MTTFWKLCGLLGVLVVATSLTVTAPTFVDSQVLTAAQLNGAFNSIKAAVNGGLTDSNLSASAAISRSKLAPNMLIPVATGRVISCGAAPTTCTGLITNGVTAVTHDSTGVYTITLDAAPSTTTNNAFITLGVDNATATTTCTWQGLVSPSLNTFSVRCSGATAFSFAVWAQP